MWLWLLLLLLMWLLLFLLFFDVALFVNPLIVACEIKILFSQILKKIIIITHPRLQDMNLWSSPALDFGSATPSSVHLSGAAREAELAAIQRQMAAKDAAQRIVKDASGAMKFHRLPASTELRESGGGCADQLTRLSNILKDAPKKKGLTLKPVHRIPPLGVLDGKTSVYVSLALVSGFFRAAVKKISDV